MLQIDPIRPPARHARRPNVRRYVTGALEVLGILAAMALLFWILTAASAVAPGQPGAFGARVAHVATRAAQRFTPSRAPLTHGYVRQARTGHVRTVHGTSRTGR